MLAEFLDNVLHNLFKPLLLFFYLGFAVPMLRVPFEFPHVLYQGLTIYLLISIGWHGGEELATLDAAAASQALGFMVIGFVTNFCIGCFAYFLLRRVTALRKIDAATVAGYYGSDSAGTFVTCLGVLATANIAYAAYMPVMLAVMEIPGCLVALFLVSRLRDQGMDPLGNAPDEPGYDPNANNGVDQEGTTRGRSNGHGNGNGKSQHPQPRAAARSVSQPRAVLAVRRNSDRFHQPVARRQSDGPGRLAVRRSVSANVVPVPARDGHDGLQAIARPAHGRLAVHRFRRAGTQRVCHDRHLHRPRV